ncbi:GyrI-like domain-containing protein [Formosa sp. S-31]|uniref:GyrI-like domain-containing protein n=1 Tax=Formosa sp. S-31 TaxID=2790949 RepID=UPI003EB8B2D6
MKFAKYFLLLLLIGFIGSSIYIAVQPNNLFLTKIRIIEAPQEVIYDHINDLNTWKDWSPWPKTDSGDTLINSDTYTWLNDNEIGNISTISHTKPNALKQALSFPKYPESELDWELNPVSKTSTQVTWTLSSKTIPFKKKAMYVFFGNPESELDSKFEASLTKLDSAVQKSMQTYSISLQGITHHSGGYYLFKTASGKTTGFHKIIEKIAPEVNAYVKSNNIITAGAPFVYYHKWDTINNAVIFSYCIPTSTQIISSKEDILTGFFEPFKTTKTTLKGDYKYLDKAWGTTFDNLKTENLTAVENGPMLETYVTNPEQIVNPANWITELYVAIKDQDSIPAFSLHQTE